MGLISECNTASCLCFVFLSNRRQKKTLTFRFVPCKASFPFTALTYLRSDCMASLMTSFWFWRIYQSSFNHKWHSFLPLQNISQNAKIIDSLLASLLGLSAESSSTSSVTVTWDPMQSLRNGDTVEYLLQAQCVGKDLDFRQVCWVRSHVRMDIYLLASYSRLLSYCFAHVTPMWAKFLSTFFGEHATHAKEAPRQSRMQIL